MKSDIGWSRVMGVWFLWICVFFVLYINTHQTQQIEKPKTPVYSADEELFLLEPSKPKDFKYGYEYIGAFTCTAYCPCLQCCGQYAYDRPVDKNGNPIVYGATGNILTPGVSVAVNPNVIPFGSVLVIDGKEYVAEDTGGFSGYHLDFYFATHEEALAFGMQTKEVYLKINS